MQQPPSTKVPVSLQLNCGFARCAIRQLTPRDGTLDKQKHETEFKKLFKPNASFGLPENYFKDNLCRASPFERHSTKILQNWKRKWHLYESKSEYEETFSIEKWQSLSTEEKDKHTLAICKQCDLLHHQLQHQFPLGPYLENNRVLTVNTGSLETLGELNGTKEAITMLNESFNEAFNKDFIDSRIHD